MKHFHFNLIFWTFLKISFAWTEENPESIQIHSESPLTVAEKTVKAAEEIKIPDGPLNLKMLREMNPGLNDDKLIEKLIEQGANFKNANFEELFLKSGEVARKFFGSSLNLSGANFDLLYFKIEFNEPLKFRGHFENVSFKSAAFPRQGVDFTEAYLEKANFKNTALNYANFENKEIENVSFSHSTLKEPNFKGATLNQVDFNLTRIINPILLGSQWKNVYFSDVNFELEEKSTQTIFNISISNNFITADIPHDLTETKPLIEFLTQKIIITHLLKENPRLESSPPFSLREILNTLYDKTTLEEISLKIEKVIQKNVLFNPPSEDSLFLHEINEALRTQTNSSIMKLNFREDPIPHIIDKRETLHLQDKTKEISLYFKNLIHELFQLTTKELNHLEILINSSPSRSENVSTTESPTQELENKRAPYIELMQTLVKTEKGRRSILRANVDYTKIVRQLKELTSEQIDSLSSLFENLLFEESSHRIEDFTREEIQKLLSMLETKKHEPPNKQQKVSLPIEIQNYLINKEENKLKIFESYFHLIHFSKKLKIPIHLTTEIEPMNNSILNTLSSLINKEKVAFKIKISAVPIEAKFQLHNILRLINNRKKFKRCDELF